MKHTSCNTLLAETLGVIRCDSDPSQSDSAPGAFSTLPKGSQHIGSMTSSANGAGVLPGVGLEFWRKFQQFVLCGHSVISIPIHYHSCSSFYPLLALRLGHACKIKTFKGTTVRSDEPRWYFRPFSWVESLRNHPYIGHWGMLTWPVSDSWRDVEGIAIRYPLSLWHNGVGWPVIACNSFWVSALQSFFYSQKPLLVKLCSDQGAICHCW